MAWLAHTNTTTQSIITPHILLYLSYYRINMALLSTLSTIAPYHLLLYSVLYGATTYQSFYSGIVAFRALSYESFATLQHAIFPKYFGFQTVASAALLLSTPFAATTLSYTALGIPLATALINSLYLGPASNRLIKQRLAQAEAEGKSHKDPNASPEMKRMNKQFGKLHGISVLLNLVLWISLGVYGVQLTEGLAA